MEVERPKNGHVEQPQRRRPDPADASLRTTDGFFHSQMLGLMGSQGSPKSRQSSYRTTPNGDHPNGSTNSALNGSTTTQTARDRGAGIRSAWDLPDLIRPLPVRRRPYLKRPKLLPHYPAVVEYVYTNRYATADQARRRFPEYLTSQRTAQYQLANLVSLGYVATASVRSTSPNFPFVYYATSRGVRLVRDAYAALGVAWSGVATEANRSRGVAIQSLLHEVLLTEIDLAVWQTVQGRPDIQRLFSERRYFRPDRRLSYIEGGRRRLVLPDLGFLVRIDNQATDNAGSRTSSLWLTFVEFDNGTMPLRRVAAKYRQYEEWSCSSEGERYLANLYGQHGGEQFRPNFRLLMVAHDKSRPEGDERRLIDLVAQTLNVSGRLRDRLWLTTAASLQATATEQAPLDAPIWLRARDMRPWLADYRSQPGCNGRRGKSTTVVQRQFVRDRLHSLPYHTFFPRRNAPVRA